MAAFVVVLGADSDARFPEGKSLTINAFPTSLGEVRILYATRHADEGYESSVPREMWVDVRGDAEAELAEAIGVYANAAAQFLPLVATTTNAWVGYAEPKLAFDATPHVSERKHFSSFVREEAGTLPRPGRNVPVEPTVALLQAVASHRETARLRRAIDQYALALGHWKIGHETLALAHLFMGMEALTPAALRRERERTGLDDTALAAKYGSDDVRQLSASIRRGVLFQADDEAATKARQASDGFEHGFLDFTRMRTLAAEVRDRTATYLRTAILNIADLDAASRAVLEAPPYDTPLRSFLARYMWGTLLGEAEDLAAGDQAYPILKWRSRMKDFKRNEDGTYSITPEETMTPSFNEALEYRQDRFEVWGPDGAGVPPDDNQSGEK